MGLDMFLSRKKYIGANYEHRNVKGVIYVTIQGKEIPIDFNRISYIEEEGGYWRKANAIHKWFVDNCQNGNDDCGHYYVSLSQLKELLKLCKEVKKKAILKEGKVKNGYTIKDGKQEPIMEDGKYIENSEEIAKILPTTDGFFFGSVDYNEWYLKDIEYTIKMLSELIKDETKLNELGVYSDFEYHASW